MNLKKIIKMSACALCLGTVITGLSLAMENNEEGPRKEEQNQEVCAGNLQQDDVYAREYEKLRSFYEFREE